MDINTEIDRKEQILKLISRFSDKPSKAQVALFFEKYHSQDIAEQLESLEINDIISFWFKIRKSIFFTPSNTTI